MDRSSPRATARPAIGALLLAGLFAWLVLAGLRLERNAPHDYDEYYHLGLARELRAGTELSSFRWTPFSIAHDRFVDKEPLFHLLLLPLAPLPLERAALLGAVLGQLFVVAALCWSLWRLRVPGAAWFPLALPALGPLVLARLLDCRPHLLLIGFAIVTLTLLVERCWKSLAVCSALFGLAHAGGWIAIPMALVWTLAGLLTREEEEPRLPWQPLVATVGGWIAGQLFHPQLPANFGFLAVQTFVVPFQAMGGGDAALQRLLGSEFAAPDGRVLREQWPALLAGLVVVAALAFHRGLRSRATITGAAVALAFLGVASVQLRRFFELGAPLALIAVALLVRERQRSAVDAWFRGGGRVAAALAIALALLSTLSAQRRSDVGKWSPPRAMAQWLAEHGKAGERVFTVQWADSAPLFYSAPHLQSLVALDPTFFYRKDPRRFATYARIASARHPDPLGAIREQFGARWITVWRAFPSVGRQLQQMGAQIAYDDPDYVIFDLALPLRPTPPLRRR